MITIGGVSSAGAASTYFAKDNYYTKSQGLGESQWFGKGAEDLGLIEAEQVIEPDAEDLNPENDSPRDDDREQNNEKGNERTDQKTQRESTLSNTDPSISLEDDATTKDADTDREKLAEKDVTADGMIERGVDAADLKAVLEGRTPDGERLGSLGKNGEWKHVPGKDMVFAPSKSVSIMALVAGDKRLVTEFQESVKSTLKYAERNYASVQDNPSKGEKSSFKTGNLTAALFTHDTSRNQDPLLHVHAVIANMTKDPRTDQWRALNKRALYKNVYNLSRIQRADFAKRVQKLGYNIEFGKHGNFEITAVPVAVRDEFSSRRLEIVEKMDGKEGSFGERRTATLATRVSKTELPRDQLTAKWKDRAEGHGFRGEDHIPSSEQGMKLDYINHSRAVTEAIEHTTYNQTTVSRGALVAYALAHPHSNGNIDTIEAGIDAAHKAGDLVIHTNHQNTAETFYTTKEQIAAERSIQGIFDQTRDQKPLEPRAFKVRQHLARPHSINGRDITLNETQQSAMLHVLTTEDKYIGVQGLAGVGKTTALGVAVKTLNDLNKYNPFLKAPKVVGMAPTIAAASELAEKTGGTSSTIQKYVARHRKLLDGKTRPSQSSLKDYKGAIILQDESSMLSNQMQLDFMKINEILGVEKVVFIGDTGQHGSVKAGPAFKMMQDYGMKTTVMGEIMRQKNDRLLSAAKAFSSHDFHKGFKIMKDSIHEGADYISDAAAAYVENRVNAKDTTLMTMDNATRIETNRSVRRELQDRNLIGQTDYNQDVLLPTYLTPVEASYAPNYITGDHLMFSQDIYQRQMEAGDVWKIQSIENETNSLIIEKDGETERWNLTKLEEQPFEHLRESSIDLSERDEIKFKVEDKDQDIKREQRGTITEINESTMTIQVAEGNTLTIARDDQLAARIDHSYTNTSYLVQGQTTEHGIAVINPYSRASNREGMSVIGTRAEHSLEIYTSNEDEMKRNIENNDGSDKIASHAIGLEQANKASDLREEIKIENQTRDIVREQSKVRGGAER